MEKYTRGVSETKTKKSTDDDFLVDTETDNCDVFYWSLSKQFQNMFGLHESSLEENDSTMPATMTPVTITPQTLSPDQIHDIVLDAIHHYKEEHNSMPETVAPQKLSTAQIRNIFLDAIHRYNIMEIINREPAVWTRHDSITLNVFV